MINLFRKSIGTAAAVLTLFSASAGENFLSLSLGDLYAIAKGDGRVDSPERIEASLKNWKTLIEGSAVLWRIEDQHIEFFEMAKTGYIKWHRDKVVEMQKKFHRFCIDKT